MAEQALSKFLSALLFIGSVREASALMERWRVRSEFQPGRTLISRTPGEDRQELAVQVFFLRGAGFEHLDKISWVNPKSADMLRDIFREWRP